MTLKYYWNVSLWARGQRDATLSKFRILHAGFGDVDPRERNLGPKLHLSSSSHPQLTAEFYDMAFTLAKVAKSKYQPCKSTKQPG
jgi:hypothetical protein